MRLAIFVAVNVGDEGGFAPNVANPEECLELLMAAIGNSGHTGKISIALDVAASGILLLGVFVFVNIS